MTQSLAKLELPQSDPDMVCQAQVPSSWLELGLSIEVDIPRKLRCAPCDGGGCDHCGRSGAHNLFSKGDSGPTVRVHLPKGQGGRLALRVPVGQSLLLLQLSPGSPPGWIRCVTADQEASGGVSAWRAQILVGGLFILALLALWLNAQY